MLVRVPCGYFIPAQTEVNAMPRPRPSRSAATSTATDEALREVKAIYTDLAARPIERACTLRTECCHFRLTGKTPHLTRGEALYAAKGVRASGRKALPDRADGACPMLGPLGRCQMYDHRPFGCRTHFCGPAGGPYPRKEVQDLIQRLEAVDEKLGGDGAMPFSQAIRAVMG